MTKSSSLPRRPKASRPGTVSKTARDFNSKRRGELAELRFTLKAATQGFAVSKPYGDSERYDFIVDPRNCHPRVSAAHHSSESSHLERRKAPRRLSDVHPQRTDAIREAGPLSQSADPLFPSPLYRVQIKCSTQLLNGLYRVNAHRRTHGRAVPYLPSEIDFLIAYIIPEDTWYVIPIHAVRATSLLFRRKKDRRPGLYDQYREAWHQLRL